MYPTDPPLTPKHNASIWEPQIKLLRVSLTPPTEDETSWSAEGLRIIDLADGTVLSDAATLNNVYQITEVAFSEAQDMWAAADANLQEQITGNVPLEASAFSPISWHKQVVENSVNIPSNVNAWSFGPEIAIAPGATVTIGEGSNWTIANGELVQ